MSFLKRLAGLTTATLLFAGVAAAQSGPEFFEGKTVNYVVATDPGGGYDTNGRLVAKFMEKHLPGSTFVIRNMPGAGHMIGASYVYSAAPDGLTLGTFNTGLVYAQLTGEAGDRFDLGKMSWVGKLASDPRVIIVAKDSGIASFADLAARKEPVRFAAAGVGSASTVETQMLINALGLPVELITGYDGNDGLLAIRRGEVQGILGARSSLEPFVKEGHGVMLAQIGGSQTDVPQLASLVEGNEAGQRVISLVTSQADISRLTAAPPGVPEEVLETLRGAYQAAVTDPEFLAEAAKLELPVDPMVGAPLAEAVSGALNQTPEMVEFLKATLQDD